MCNLKNWHEFLAVLTLAIAILFALPANIFAEGENPSSWRLVKTPAKNITVTIQSSIALNPNYYLGTYYIVYSDYAAAHEGCDRMSIEMSLPEANLQARPVKATSGRTYWVIPFKLKDFVQFNNWNNITAVVKFNVRTYRIRLSEGIDAPMQINAEDRKRFTAATARYDYNDSSFQNYVTSCNLRRFEGEPELDFFHRVYKSVTQNIKYQPGPGKSFKASTTINLTHMNCEAASLFISSVMRLNGIPAKVEGGNNASKDIPLSPSPTPHAVASAYISGIGWITTDPSKEMADKYDAFREFTGNFIPWINLGEGAAGEDKIEVDGNTIIVIPSLNVRVYPDNIKDQQGKSPTIQPYSTKQYWEVKVKNL